MGQQIRRGGPQFYRGGSRAGAPRFPNSGGFDPNWNSPPMYGNSHMGYGNIQSDQNSASFHQVRLIILGNMCLYAMIVNICVFVFALNAAK